jgi:hypothetical protein
VRADQLDANAGAALLVEVLRAVAKKAGYRLVVRGNLGQVQPQGFEGVPLKGWYPPPDRQQPWQPDHALRGRRDGRETACRGHCPHRQREIPAALLVHRGIQKIHLFGAPVSPDPRKRGVRPPGRDESFVCSCALEQRRMHAVLAPRLGTAAQRSDSLGQPSVVSQDVV